MKLMQPDMSEIKRFSGLTAEYTNDIKNILVGNSETLLLIAKYTKLLETTNVKLAQIEKNTK